MKAFLGIKITASLFNVTGLFLILGGASLFGMIEPRGEISISFALLVASISFAIAFWFFIVARHLKKLRKRGFSAAIITIILLMLFHIFATVAGFFLKEVGVAIFNLVFSLVCATILVYLNRWKVRDLFH